MSESKGAARKSTPLPRRVAALSMCQSSHSWFRCCTSFTHIGWFARKGIQLSRIIVVRSHLPSFAFFSFALLTKFLVMRSARDTGTMLRNLAPRECGVHGTMTGPGREEKKEGAREERAEATQSDERGICWHW